MKTYMVVYEGKTYQVKGNKLWTGNNLTIIYGENDEEVAIFPATSFVADKACVEVQAKKAPNLGTSFV